MRTTGAVVVAVLMLCSYIQAQEGYIRGVNIGGWLLLESWITPSLFRSVNNNNIKDEWSWGQYGGSKTLLTQHWDTWLTENDLQTLQKAGLSHLRIPIGYWIVMTAAELKQYNEPYVTGAWPYLSRAISWAKKYNFKVLIDLHGAPGGQNGFDNCGHTGAGAWGTGDTVDRTITYLERISQNILDWEKTANTSGVVVGLELINEPAPWVISGGMTTIRNFYTKAYPAIRKLLPDTKYWFVIQQGFQTDWQNFMTAPTYQNVYLDMHIYHAFSPYPPNQSQQDEIKTTCGSDKNEITSQTLWTFTGEWSLGTIDTHWDSSTLKQFYHNWGLAQMSVWETGTKGKGWFFWNFKTETSDEWNYIKAVQSGWFPSPLPNNLNSTSYCNV